MSKIEKLHPHLDQVETVDIENPLSRLNSTEPARIAAKMNAAGNPLLKLFKNGKISVAEYKAGEILGDLINRSEISPMRAVQYEPRIRSTTPRSMPLSSLEKLENLNRIKMQIGVGNFKILEAICHNGMKITEISRNILGAKTRNETNQIGPKVVAGIKHSLGELAEVWNLQSDKKIAA